jgi:hypothetical protein
MSAMHPGPTFTEFERAIGGNRAVVKLHVGGKRNAGPLLATLEMIGGQGVTITFDHQEEQMRARAAAARCLAAMFDYVASMRDDGNMVGLDHGEISIPDARFQIDEPDIAFVEHYFGVELIDDYHRVTYGTCATCGGIRYQDNQSGAMGCRSKGCAQPSVEADVPRGIQLGVAARNKILDYMDDNFFAARRPRHTDDIMRRNLVALGVVAVVLLDDAGLELARAPWHGQECVDLTVARHAKVGAIEWQTADGKWHARETAVAGNTVEPGQVIPVSMRLTPAE